MGIWIVCGSTFSLELEKGHTQMKMESLLIEDVGRDQGRESINQFARISANHNNSYCNDNISLAKGSSSSSGFTI